MKVTCSDCGRKLARDDINIDKMMGICPQCSNVITIKNTDDDVVNDRRYAMSKRISINSRGGDLNLEVRWFSLVGFVLLFFCTIWDGFMIVWFYIAITKKIWLMAVCGTIHGLVGVVLTYFTLCVFVNRTVINVNRYKLKTVHKPLPWFGEIELDAREIEQLYCKEIVSRSDSGTSVTYELWLIVNSEHKRIMRGAYNSNDVKYLEQEIENYLGIENEAVNNEYNG